MAEEPLEKARRIRAEKLKQAEIDKAQEAKQRLERQKDSVPAMEKQYDAALAEVKKFAGRKAFSEKEEKAWDKLTILGGRLRATLSAIHMTEQNDTQGPRA